MKEGVMQTQRVKLTAEQIAARTLTSPQAFLVSNLVLFSQKRPGVMVPDPYKEDEKPKFKAEFVLNMSHPVFARIVHHICERAAGEWPDLALPVLAQVPPGSPVHAQLAALVRAGIRFPVESGRAYNDRRLADGYAARDWANEPGVAVFKTSSGEAYPPSIGFFGGAGTKAIAYRTPLEQQEHCREFFAGMEASFQVFFSAAKSPQGRFVTARLKMLYANGLGQPFGGQADPSVFEGQHQGVVTNASVLPANLIAPVPHPVAVVNTPVLPVAPSSPEMAPFQPASVPW
jgi:hypothetical protein